MNMFTDILPETYWYKNGDYILFGVLVVPNVHFLILSLKWILVSLLMMIVRFLNNNVF